MTQKLKKTRIMVAGARGFIGSHMVQLLQEQPDNEVIPIDLDLLDLSETSAIDALPTGVDPATVVRLLVQADMEVFQITELGLAGISDEFYQRPNPHLLAARGEKTSLVRTELAAGAGLP